MNRAVADPPAMVTLPLAGLWGQMNTSIGVRAARNRFSELIERAARGEAITITRRGKPVALLLPPEPGSDVRRVRADVARSAIVALRETRRGVVLGESRIAELRAEGRR